MGMTSALASIVRFVARLVWAVLKVTVRIAVRLIRVYAWAIVVCTFGLIPTLAIVVIRRRRGRK